ISNIETCERPPNTGFSLSSELIMRLLDLSCRPFLLMYPHSFFVTSVRGIGLPPITAASVALGLIGFMNAAFGLRALFFFAGFFAALLTFFFEALPFFAFAISCSPGDVR